MACYINTLCKAAVALFAFTGFTGITEASEKSSTNSKVEITTKSQGNNAALIALLPNNDIVPEIQFSIRVVVTNPPESASVRLSVQGIDSDGFQVTAIKMPEFRVREGATTATTRWVEMAKSKYSRVVAWKIANFEVLQDTHQIELVDIIPKVVNDGKNETLSIKARLVNRNGKDFPPWIVLQGIDSDGFGVTSMHLFQTDAVHSKVRGNELEVEYRGLSAWNVERVSKWQTVPVLSNASVSEMLPD